jgi:hypothetical protein
MNTGDIDLIRSQGYFIMLRNHIFSLVSLQFIVTYVNITFDGDISISDEMLSCLSLAEGSHL